VDIIFISELAVETIIGVYDWEREIKQPVLFDIEMSGDCARAAATDAVGDTLNYKDVAKAVIGFVEKSECQLVETLAEQVAALILAEFNVQWLRLRVNKRGAIRGATGVGVVIERGRKT